MIVDRAKLRRGPACTLLLAAGLALPCTTANAQEVFGGIYVHEVDTPFTLPTNEGGADVSLGYRFAPVAALDFIGKPQPYVIGVLNSQGDTSFAGLGLSWSLGKGPVYVRPGIGVVVHGGPERRVEPSGRRTDLGSRVLFQPEIAVGYRVSERVSLEASWLHISQAQIFDSYQNPGIDMMGLRLNYRLR